MSLRFSWLLLPLTAACVTPSVASREEDLSLPGENPRPMVIIETPPRAKVQREYIYNGGHPIPDEYGGGWCIEEGAHAHPYLPAAEEQYVATNGGYSFRTDLTEWSYEYDHPVPEVYGGGWCTIVEVHHHHYRPWITYWWNPERHVYVYVNDSRRVPGQRIVRGTIPRDRRPAGPIEVPTGGVVAKPVPAKPVEPSGPVARPVTPKPIDTGTPVARPVPAKPVEPVTVRPVEPVPAVPIVRPRPMEFDVPSSRPPVVVTPEPVRPVPAPPSNPVFNPTPNNPPVVETRPSWVPGTPPVQPPTPNIPPPRMNPLNPNPVVMRPETPRGGAVFQPTAPVVRSNPVIQAAPVMRPNNNVVAAPVTRPNNNVVVAPSTQRVTPVPTIGAPAQKKSGASVVKSR